MFSVLVSDGKAWEGSAPYEMHRALFKKFSESEGNAVDIGSPKSLLRLKGTQGILIYKIEYDEDGKIASSHVARLGTFGTVWLEGEKIRFEFMEQKQLHRFQLACRSEVRIEPRELSSVQWAIKNGILPDDFGVASIVPQTDAASAEVEQRTEGPQQQYDVLLSYAREQQAYVEAVARHLNVLGLTVFFDQFEQTYLWGKHLPETFTKLFERSGRVCVVFVSQEYSNKLWTKLELRAAISNAIYQHREYLLPVRFDDADLDGLNSSIAYLDARKIMPGELAFRIAEKLQQLGGMSEHG